MTPFSHLHVHTQYSLLDGASNIDKLYQKAMRDGMPALAITDHGNMFGVFDFVRQAWKNTKVVGKTETGKDILEPIVKPIIGCEFYVVADRHKKIFSKEAKDERFHQLFLAMNETGYKNLVKLTSLGYIEGMYSKYPRIDKELIEKYHEGLIATTCCIGAMVPQALLQKGEEAAEREFKWWLDLFGENYYIELQRHNMKEQDLVNNFLLKMAAKHEVPVIASNDAHYVDNDDYNAHDILLCVNTGEKQSTPGFDDFIDDSIAVKNRRFKFPNDQFYFKTTHEMKQVFADVPQAIDNTNAIVDKVKALKLEKDILLPAFPIPAEFKTTDNQELNQWQYLHHLTYEGARKRYGTITPEVQERLDFELNTIKIMGFAGYFLIVSDFIKAGKEMGVYVGPGRGSAAGSAVAYCIEITNVDPIKYDLLFERFLNPDRKSMPDIDTDFDDDGRQKVIDYVVQKYGTNQVAQIVTYGTMAAKSSINDVARVMDLPLMESRALTKMLPDKMGLTLKRVFTAPLTKTEGEKSLEEKEGLAADDLDKVKKLRELHASNTLEGSVLREAERLEGSIRNTGIHAAGIIIAPTDLTDLIPVATAKDSNLWVTQIEGNSIESAGVIKMDFLGLKTLSILKSALEMLKRTQGVEIDLDDIPLTDEKTYELYQKAETNCIFQFESPGMQKYMKELKPDKLGDLIAMNALYRPGPLAYIPSFIARKHGKEPVAYDLPEMAEYLEETYGITVYQEQVMLLSQKLANFTKGEADVLRKAMGKKDRKTLDKLRPDFMERAKAKGHPEKVLEKIWTDWEAFAQYAFNKSHSTCYAIVSYQAAYLKANYPKEFMSAVLNHSANITDTEKYLQECKRMGITVLGPDVNESEKGFAVSKTGAIRFGLGALKGVGEAAIDSIIAERKNGVYTSPFNLITRVNTRAVNKRALEALVYGGAFDCFKNMHRAQYFFVPSGDKTTGIEKIIAYANTKQSLQTNTTNTLFGNLEEAIVIPEPKIPNCEPWPNVTQLDYEKEVTGMFLSGHPLNPYRFEFDLGYFTSLEQLAELEENTKELEKQDGRSFKVAGFITKFEERTTKTGNKFGSFTVEDFSKSKTFVVFGQEYLRIKPLLQEGLNVVLTIRVSRRFKTSDIEAAVADAQLLENFRANHISTLRLIVDYKTVDKEIIQFLGSYIPSHPGNTLLKILLYTDGENADKEMFMLEYTQHKMAVTDEFIQFFENYPYVEMKAF